ncbi:MAG: Na/Pi cotransporter family protein [Candidatus Electrothrix sp. ATG2]|nr:Na/Pi cotransporter family protein [Candidatus Electrothrix sp. ATG2]
MLRKVFLPTIFLVLAYGFWISPDFKEIAAGVAIFLFGMLSLEEGFKAFTGGALERILRRTTDKLWKSLSFGIVSTSIMQSSSLVSVLTISFLSAGLISLADGIGIIFGANLGTTTGAWLVAGFGLKVKISAYAMPMLVFGIILIFQQSKNLKGIGYVLSGLGFLFLGIHHMKEGFEAFKDGIDLVSYAVPGMKGLFIFTIIGVFATVVMQSSHATLVLIITALAAQQISYENALALAIGANVGTTITAILGAMSSNVAGRRLAGAHLIFNVITGLIAIIFMNQFITSVNFVSNNVGIAENDFTLKLAVFHTLFNLVGMLVMLPFVGLLVTFLEGLMRGKVKKISEPYYLSEAVLEMPDAAIEALRKEADHLFKNASNIIALTLNVKLDHIRSDADLTDIVDRKDRMAATDIDEYYNSHIKPLYNAIVAFVSKIRIDDDSDQHARLYDLRTACRYIVEAVKDMKHLQKNLISFSTSDNVTIKREYRSIRFQIASLLRKIEKIRTDEDITSLSLDELKVEVERNDILASGSLDHLIRGHLITADMATSLINDSAYLRDVTDDLIETVRTLFAPYDPELKKIEDDMALLKDEIKAILEEK